jgi:hypothetical protein
LRLPAPARLRAAPPAPVSTSARSADAWRGMECVSRMAGVAARAAAVSRMSSWW